MYINIESHVVAEPLQIFFNHRSADETVRFKVGFTKADGDPDIVTYLRSPESGSEWLTHLQLMQISSECPMRLKRGGIVHIEKEGCASAETEVRRWDTGEGWPRG